MKQIKTVSQLPDHASQRYFAEIVLCPLLGINEEERYG
jgi:hypothetical protein